ncbi:MAG: ribokinase [Qingshengfaniella sp.]
MTVAVFGSVNLDLTVYVQALPRPGQTIHADRQVIGLGGKGANQAVAAQKLSATPVRLIAATGADAFGQTLRTALAENGIALDHVAVFDDVPSGNALIHVDARSQNVITVTGGANMAWPDAGPGAEGFAGVGVALFQLETPLVATLAAMRAARAAGATVILDPAPIPRRDLTDVLAEADVATPNETEAEALVGIRPEDPAAAIAAARALVTRGPRLAIVKMGARGLAYATVQGETGIVPPFAVTAVDTVAAGDSFNGALAVALDEGLPVPQALRFAAAAGALATTRFGASAAAPSRAEVERLIGDQADPGTG